MDNTRIRKQVKMQLALLLGVGLPVGFVAGIAGATLADTLAETGEILAWGFRSLALFLSLALAGSIWLSADNELALEQDFRPREVYRSRDEALATGALGGILGTLGATVSYFFPAQSIPLLVKGYEANSVMEESLRQLGFGQFCLVIAVVVIVGLLVSLWAHRRVKGSYY